MQHRAFTVVELLVVVLVTAILASLLARSSLKRGTTLREGSFALFSSLSSRVGWRYIRSKGTPTFPIGAGKSGSGWVHRG